VTERDSNLTDHPSGAKGLPQDTAVIDTMVVAVFNQPPMSVSRSKPIEMKTVVRRIRNGRIRCPFLSDTTRRTDADAPSVVAQLAQHAV
jgi:hypothetical protein